VFRKPWGDRGLDASLAYKMTTKAKCRVALVHAAKFSWRARIAAVPLNELDVLVTEAITPEAAVALKESGVEVIVAPVAREADPASRPLAIGTE